MKFWLLILFSLATLQLAISTDLPECGRQAGNASCPFGRCCSIFGYCGITPDYCGTDCESQCNADANGVASIVTPAMFDQMFMHRNDSRCQGSGFYTYEAFVNAAKTFNGFGTTGDYETRVREVAAFLAQTSHETTGGWPSAPDGPYAWGYCFVQEKNPPNNYCDSSDWPCPSGCQYYGRGPIQLSHNHNYGLAGVALGLDLINNPEILATNATASFRAAIWFWMTAQCNKPSIHDAFTGSWTPSPSDKAAGRVSGYGLITNIINGGIECGQGKNDKVANRIGFYRRYCKFLGVSPGENLDCYKQKPFGSG